MELLSIALETWKNIDTATIIVVMKSVENMWMLDVDGQSSNAILPHIDATQGSWINLFSPRNSFFGMEHFHTIDSNDQTLMSSRIVQPSWNLST